MNERLSANGTAVNVMIAYNFTRPMLFCYLQVMKLITCNFFNFNFNLWLVVRNYLRNFFSINPKIIMSNYVSEPTILIAINLTYD
mgnify:CR=1 FL=1